MCAATSARAGRGTCTNITLAWIYLTADETNLHYTYHLIHIHIELKQTNVRVVNKTWTL